MDKTKQKQIALWLSLAGMAGILWILRSWNLEIGDGEFCCKQTAGDHVFPITLSRCPLSHLLYRAVFFTLHGLWGWWVEDCIALCSCAAGVLFFWSLFRYASQIGTDWWQFLIFILFPSSTLLFQVFCGHIEFYPWTCALLMLSGYLAWLAIEKKQSLLWPSLAMAFAAAFHSSGVFYFPVLLFLPLLQQKKEGERLWPDAPTWKKILLFFGLFLVTALIHRKPYWHLLGVILVVPAYFYLIPAHWKTALKEYWPIYLPWFFLFTIRAAFGLRAEPLIEHLPPLVEPYSHKAYLYYGALLVCGIYFKPFIDSFGLLSEHYDHGAYLYAGLSWDHLYDKTMFHLWLMPFGLLTFLVAVLFFRKLLSRDRWAFFLFHFSFWGLLWMTLFYPQLRTRDWDLFATVAVSVNLFTVYFWYKLLPMRWFRITLPIMILIQAGIAGPILWKNSSLGVDRGYVQLRFDPSPVQSNVFLRGLLLLQPTPLEQAHVRAGMANIRIVPLQRGHASWEEDRYLVAGQSYVFDPVLQSIEVPPIPTNEEIIRE
ncbi:MAG: hypothetical protein RBU29_02555 [bacterium]|jgi:hypothetical protein|nr:hypothetical protein [bacterium]